MTTLFVYKKKEVFLWLERRKNYLNRADGLYEIKITVGKNINGSPIRKSFYSSKIKEDTRKQAEEYNI